jgi:hypothetical protein
MERLLLLLLLLASRGICTRRGGQAGGCTRSSARYRAALRAIFRGGCRAAACARWLLRRGAAPCLLGLGGAGWLLGRRGLGGPVDELQRSRHVVHVVLHGAPGLAPVQPILACSGRGQWAGSPRVGVGQKRKAGGKAGRKATGQPGGAAHPWAAGSTGSSCCAGRARGAACSGAGAAAPGRARSGAAPPQSGSSQTAPGGKPPAPRGRALSPCAGGGAWRV